eukprot:2459418-Rhodomonas_salina.1
MSVGKKEKQTEKERWQESKSKSAAYRSLGRESSLDVLLGELRHSSRHIVRRNPNLPDSERTGWEEDKRTAKETRRDPARRRTSVTSVRRTCHDPVSQWQGNKDPRFRTAAPGSKLAREVDADKGGGWCVCQRESVRARAEDAYVLSLGTGNLGKEGPELDLLLNSELILKRPKPPVRF